MTSDADDDGIFKSSTSLDSRYSAVFEDDGEVAYGYLLLDGAIISDVWLYNGDDTRPERIVPVSDDEEVSIVWMYDRSSVPIAVQFWIRGALHAGISVG